MCIIIHISYNTKMAKALESPPGKKLCLKCITERNSRILWNSEYMDCFSPSRFLKSLNDYPSPFLAIFSP